jgi:hypothetical protein
VGRGAGQNEYREAASTRVVRIAVDPTEPAARDLWLALTSLSHELRDLDGWCLVGGLMVGLFAYEHGRSARTTTDIDILGDARKRPSVTELLARRLSDLKATVQRPSGLDHELGYQFNLDGHVIEILGPDGMSKKAPPRTIGKLETISIPGGSQAFGRLEEVEITVAGSDPIRIRRPNLLAALLLKARALKVHQRPEDQREDVILLLGLFTDPRAARQQLTGNQQSWLSDIEQDLDLDDPALRERFDAAHLELAQAAFHILTGSR